MVTPWASRRARRRLAGIVGPDEQFVHVERLRPGGWWVTTDQALYQVPTAGDPERVTFAEIGSVHSLSSGSPVIVVTAPGRQPLIGDLRADSRIAEQLRRLRPMGAAED